MCVSANNNNESSSEISNTSEQSSYNISEKLDDENSLHIIEPEILYQKRLRSLNNAPDTYKTVTSYENGTNKYFIEIVTKFDHFGTPIHTKTYRQPDKIKLTPNNYLDIIKFISSSIKGTHKNLGNNLYISRFDNPYHVTLWKETGLSNSKFRILLFDWLEIKDLISISSNILYDTYEFII